MSEDEGTHQGAVVLLCGGPRRDARDPLAAVLARPERVPDRTISQSSATDWSTGRVIRSAGGPDRKIHSRRKRLERRRRPFPSQVVYVAEKRQLGPQCGEGPEEQCALAALGERAREGGRAG